MKRRWWEPNPETIIEDLLAAASNKRQRGDPATLADIERLRLGRVRARSNRAAVKRAELDALRKRPSRTGPCSTYALLQAMTPSEWHGSKDLVRATGAGRGADGRVEAALRSNGLVERAANPGWDPAGWRDGAKREPKWLYRLTAAGEARRLAECAL